MPIFVSKLSGYPLRLHFQIPVFPAWLQISPVPIYVICDYYINKTDLADLSGLKICWEIFAANFEISFTFRIMEFTTWVNKIPLCFGKKFQIPCVFPFGLLHLKKKTREKLTSTSSSSLLLSSSSASWSHLMSGAAFSWISLAISFETYFLDAYSHRNNLVLVNSNRRSENPLKQKAFLSKYWKRIALYRGNHILW